MSIKFRIITIFIFIFVFLKPELSHSSIIPVSNSNLSTKKVKKIKDNKIKKKPFNFNTPAKVSFGFFIGTIVFSTIAIIATDRSFKLQSTNLIGIIIFTSVFAFLFLITSFILGIIGLSNKKKPKGLAWPGVILFALLFLIILIALI